MPNPKEYADAIRTIHRRVAAYLAMETWISGHATLEISEDVLQELLGLKNCIRRDRLESFINDTSDLISVVSRRTGFLIVAAPKRKSEKPLVWEYRMQSKATREQLDLRLMQWAAGSPKNEGSRDIAKASSAEDANRE